MSEPEDFRSLFVSVASELLGPDATSADNQFGLRVESKSGHVLLEVTREQLEVPAWRVVANVANTKDLGITHVSAHEWEADESKRNAMEVIILSTIGIAVARHG